MILVCDMCRDILKLSVMIHIKRPDERTDLNRPAPPQSTSPVLHAVSRTPLYPSFTAHSRSPHAPTALSLPLQLHTSLPTPWQPVPHSPWWFEQASSPPWIQSPCLPSSPMASMASFPPTAWWS